MDIKKLALTLTVGILLALFFGFLIDAIYSEPKYEDFCGKGLRDIRAPQALDKESIDSSICEGVDIKVPVKESNICLEDGGFIDYDFDDDGCRISYSCNTCNAGWDSARETYSRNLFFILIPISIILIIIGMFLGLESIGSGFILGGLLTIAYATIRVFGDLSKVMRVVLLGVELVLVIWLGYKKIEAPKTKKKK